MADQSQRTEQPTQRRIQKAREQGQFPSSRELLGSVQFLAFVWLLSHWGPEWFERTRSITAFTLRHAFEGHLSHDSLIAYTRQLLLHSLAPVAAAAALLLVLALSVQLASTRMGFSLKRTLPDVKRVNPVPRLRELVRHNAWAVLKALILLPLFAAMAWSIARQSWETYSTLGLQPVRAGFGILANSALALLWKAAALLLVLGVLDLVRARRRYFKDLRMTRQEVREEIKDVEGNPLVKARIRRLQREMARRRMMREVPKATAVIVNPTQYAVAIRYKPSETPAPVVVAKGKNHMARKIKEIAVKHLVPIVENPPLARALYESVRVGQPIPVHLYRAVAEILAYIYRLMNVRNIG